MEKVADDLGPQLHSKKEYEWNDRLIHCVECSIVHNGDRDSNTVKSNIFVEQRKGFK